MIAALVFGWSVGELAVRATLAGLATVLAVAGLIAAWLIAQSRITLAAAAATAAPGEEERRRPVFWRLWLRFFPAAAARLAWLCQGARSIPAPVGRTPPARSPTTRCRTHTSRA